MAGERADFLAAALEVLAQQYRGRPNFRALLEVFARQFQELEDAAQQVMGERLLEATGEGTHGAIGEQLSVLERIVGQGVFLTADPVVRRAWIASRIRLNRSSGTGDDLLQIFALVLPAPLVAELTEYFPAALELRVEGGALASNLVEPLGRILQLGKAAGVGAQMLYSPSVPGAMLRFARPVAFLSAPAMSGTTGFLVAHVVDPDGLFPLDEEFDVRVGGRTAVGEDCHILSFDGSAMATDGTLVNSHEEGEEVLLIGHDYGPGFGDGSSPGGGGKMGGAV